MLSKKLAIIIFSIFSIAISSIPINEDSNNKKIITPEATGDLADYNAKAVNYLSSFDDAVISVTDDAVKYSSTAPTKEFYTIDYLNEGNLDNGYRLKYDVYYLKFIDLMFFDLSVIAKDGATIEKESLYGFPFVNENGDIDVKIDVHGVVAYASDLIGNDWIENDVRPSSPNYYLLANDYCGGGSSMYPIIAISESIATYDEALGLSASFIVVPDLLADGPLPYLYYQAKMELARLDYEHNSAFDAPVGFVNNQSYYTDWKFGLNLFDRPDGGTVSYAGCECIAIYNLLYDSGANPDLATIIALVELCNADLFLGAFGTNPIPDEVLDIYVNAFLTVFDTVIVPILLSLVPVLAAVILDVYIQLQPWWLRTVLYITYSAQYTITVVALEDAIIAATICINEFLTWYSGQLHDVGDVLQLLIGTHSLNSTGSLSTYENLLSSKRQGIVSFWNHTDNDGNVIYSGACHTVYVRANPSVTVGSNSYTYEVFNLKGYINEENSLTFSSISEILDDNNTLCSNSYPQNQYVWGYIVVN
ncbi:MAG: hypothetical protein WC201_02535 [Bacilli bacterium]